TVGGLQRYASYGESRANLNNSTLIPREHPPQCSKSAMDIAKIIYLRDAAKLGCLHLFNRREDRDHGIVDPNVDGSKALFEGCCSRLYGLIVAHIGCIGGCCPSEALNFFCCRFERWQVTRNQADTSAFLAKFMSNSSP